MNQSTVEIGAVLLAGGEGMRLRPLTARLPKPLLPVGNAPLVAQVLYGLAQGGIAHAALATGYKAAEMQATLGAQCEGVALQHIVECEPLGSGGALRHVVSQCEVGEELWVAGADILHSVDVAAALRFHRAARERGALVTIISVEVEDTTGFGICERDDEGRVVRFLEKPAPGVTNSRLANSALWIFSREALALLPEGVSSVEHDLFPLLASRGALWTWPHHGFWLDCGTPERLIEANVAALEQRFPTRLHGTREDTSLSDKNCVVAADATLARCVLGSGVVVESGARLENCVVLENAIIGADAELSACIIERGARIAPRATARERILT